MSLPAIDDIALEVGGPGSGPAGISAAHWLGLTTQVPATFVAAVPTRAPKGWGSVRFSQRPFGRRLRDLRPTEVALIEVLRAGPAVVERPWVSLGATVAALVDSGALRPEVLDEQVREEPHRDTRSRWRELVGSSTALSSSLAA